MKNLKIGVVVAIVVIVLTVFWSFNTIRTRQYNGTDISVAVGSGKVVVTNLNNEAIPVEMRAEGRTATFRVESPAIDLSATSRRQGSGRNAYHVVSFELPVGQTSIDVTRGSNVVLVNNSGTRIEAVVTPLDGRDVQWTVGIAGLVILGAAYYISGQYGHQWMEYMRAKSPVSKLRMRRNAA